MSLKNTGYVTSNGKGSIWKEAFVMRFVTVLRNLP